MAESSAAVKLLARGVWEGSYLVDDCRVLVAIDRHHRERKRVALREGVSEERAIEYLWDLLDRVDPPVTLRLVTDAPPAAPVRREIDPRLFSDPRSPLAKRRYINGLVKNAARAMPRRPADS